MINLVAVDASSTYVQGMLDGAPNSTYLVETYLNDHCDNSGFGQAQEYLGTQFFTSDANGKINLEATLPITSPLGKYLTFTATDPYSSTSELSRCALGRPAGEGAPFMVNSQADADDTDTSDGVCDSDAAEGEQCSLRAAVQQANISTGDNTILLPPGVYTLTQSGSDNSALNGDLDITDTSGGLTIAGAGADQVILQSGIADRLFDIRSGAVATITGVTMMGGHPASSGGGGVIISSGAALTLGSVNVQENESGMSGGGIYNMGTLTILNSAVVSNTSGGEGGGLYQWGADASLTLLNATLSDNEAAGNGGGLLNQSGAVYLKNVTVAYNTSSGDGGGLFNAAGSFNLQNSIVAHNIDATHAPYRNGVADCGGEFTSGGYNLIGDRARASDYPTTPDGCTLSDSVGDSIGGGRMGGTYLTYSAGLGALQFNNGSTLSRSPVAQASGLTVDLGSPATPGSGGEACEAFDQRGQPRPLDGGTDGVERCDRGAVEHIPPLLSVNDVIVNEGESANFTVSLSEPALITFTVSYSTTGGNAAAGSDYLFASGVLTFPVGAISQTVSIVTLNDAYNETSELFRLRLFNPQWIFINDGRGSAVIQDNDPAPSIAVESADAEEGATMVFTVTLNSPSGQTVTVDYTISGGSATDDEDFSMRQGTLTFAPGVTQQIVRIATLEDQYEESSETLTLALNNSQNASLGAASATGTIADNDTPAFSIADETRAENGDGATPVVMTFHVTLSKISAQTTSVAYTTVAGSASPESDYLPISGVLTFTAGQWTQTIAVTIVSDGQAEPAESFTLVLSSPTGGAILARSVASGVIEASVGRKLYLPLVTR